MCELKKSRSRVRASDLLMNMEGRESVLEEATSKVICSFCFTISIAANISAVAINAIIDR